MGAIVDRKQTSFRFSTDLIDRLREAARKENRSLNNFVESILMDVVYRKPNTVTLEAMREAESGKELETFRFIGRQLSVIRLIIVGRMVDNYQPFG